MNGFKYLVFRVYTKEERPNPVDRSVFYGWSPSKDVIKAFIKQRDKTKYQVHKLTNEEIYEMYGDSTVTYETMIDYVLLKSAQTGEEFHFFTTNSELENTEKQIQRMFHDFPSTIEGNVNYTNIIFNLDEYYLNALLYLGYRPTDLDTLFPSADYHDDLSDITRIEEQIEDAYSGAADFPQEEYDRRDRSIPGLSTIEDVANKILYSIESFIKVLKSEM